MSAEKQAEWRQILELTTAMSAAAEAGDWGSLTPLECKRRPLIPAFFTQTLGRDELEGIAEDLRRILAIDREIAELASRRHRELKNKLEIFTQGSRVVAAYDAHQG